MDRALLAGVLGTYAVGLAVGWAILNRDSPSRRTQSAGTARISALHSDHIGTGGRQALAEIARVQSLNAESFPAEFDRMVAEDPPRKDWINVLLKSWLKTELKRSSNAGPGRYWQGL